MGLTNGSFILQFFDKNIQNNNYIASFQNQTYEGRVSQANN